MIRYRWAVEFSDPFGCLRMRMLCATLAVARVVARFHARIGVRGSAIIRHLDPAEERATDASPVERATWIAWTKEHA